MANGDSNSIPVSKLITGVLITVISASIIGIFSMQRDLSSRVDAAEKDTIKLKTELEGEVRSLEEIKVLIKDVQKDVKELNQKAWQLK